MGHATWATSPTRCGSALRTGQQRLHEVALEGEEHDQRDDHREERTRSTARRCSRRTAAADSGSRRSAAATPSCVKISATSMSFQVHRNWKIASEAIAGIAERQDHGRGRCATRSPRRVARPPAAPTGSAMKKLRSRKIANGRPKATWNSTTPKIDPKMPRAPNSRAIGISADLDRHREQDDHRDEQPVAAGELHPRERVAGERADQRRRGRSSARRSGSCSRTSR